MLFARLFGTHAVRDMVQALEGDEEQAYTAQASPEVEAIAADEREHGEMWRRLSEKGAAPGVESSQPTSALGRSGTAPGSPARSGQRSSARRTASSRISPS